MSINTIYDGNVADISKDMPRTQKTVNGTTTNYHYNGSVLIGMTNSGNRSDTFRFSYDSNGNVVSISWDMPRTYNPSGTAYYLRNAQGDIVGLLDEQGNKVINYTYDSWGNVMDAHAYEQSFVDLLDYQPFLYRGYILDNETGFYYLQSRYYDPTTGRFISADVLLSTGQGVLGHNSYAYCLNNPINMSDEGGCISMHRTVAVNDGGSFGPFVDNQAAKSIGSISFGDKTIKSSGCGIVSIYNVIRASGRNIYFDDFIDDVYSEYYLPFFGGTLGARPSRIGDFLLNSFGQKNIEFCHTPSPNNDYDAMIIAYVYYAQGNIGSHYIAAINTGSTIDGTTLYKVYNDRILLPITLADLFDRMPFIICSWGINFQEGTI